MLIPIEREIPHRLDFRRIDRWLEGPMEIDAGLRDDVWRARSGPPAHASARRFFEIALLLYGELGRACGLPLFDPGRIAELAPAGRSVGRWRAVAATPCLDGISREVPGILFQHAFALLDLFARQDPVPRTVSLVFSQIEKTLIARLGKVMPHGKSTIPLCQVAHTLGLPFRHAGGGLIQLGWGSKAQLTSRSSCLQDSAIGAQTSTDKHATATLLARAGLPAPVHRRVVRLGAALDAARELGWPLVVKPADRDRGEGVTVDVRDEESLSRAFALASEAGSRVLIERLAPGICHRIMVCDGAVTFVTRRWPKSVQGDGRSTVRELVDRANGLAETQAPWKRLKPFPLDELALRCLALAGFEPGSVPGDGVRASLRPFESVEWGGDAENMTEVIHPDNAAAAIAAAEQLGLRVAGVDMITPDIGVPWHENGAIINEVNYAPYFGGKLNSPRALAFVRRVLGSDGRIPIWAVEGQSEALLLATRLQRQLVNEGLRCWLTSSARTDSPDRESAPLSATGLFDRCIALLTRRDVDALVVVVDSDEFLSTGMPVDRFERLVLLHDGPGSGESALRAALRAATRPEGIERAGATIGHAAGSDHDRSSGSDRMETSETGAELLRQEPG